MSSLIHDLESVSRQGWDPILSIENSEPPGFPIADLPRHIAAFVSGEAEFSEVDPALVGVVALGAMAVAVAGKARIETTTGHSEPLNLMICASAPPGERKSRVFGAIFGPIYEFETELIQRDRPCVGIAASKARVKRAELESVEKRLSQPIPGESNRVALLAEQTALAAELADIESPALPRLLVDDATPEKIAILLSQNGGRLGIASAEGTIFDNMMGRHSSKGVANLNIILKGHSGDSFSEDRVGRSSVEISSPALSLVLAVQHDVVASLTSKREMRGRGMLARILFAVLRAKAGSRTYRAPAVPPIVVDHFRELMRCALSVDLPTDDARVPLMKLNASASDAWLAFARDNEKHLGPGGEGEAFADWGSKLPGAVGRIAGSLHLFDNLMVGSSFEDAIETEVSLACLERAIRIGEYFRSQAVLAFGLMASSRAKGQAQDALKWLRRKGCSKITTRELQRALGSRVSSAEETREVMKLLEEHGYVRPHEERVRGRDVYRVNPALCGKGGTS